MEELCDAFASSELFCKVTNYETLLADKAAVYNLVLHGSPCNLGPIRERLLYYVQKIKLTPYIKVRAEMALSMHDDVLFAMSMFIIICGIEECIP